MYSPFKIDPSELQPVDHAAVRARINAAGVAYRERKAREVMAPLVSDQERQRIAELLAKYREVNCNPTPRVVIQEVAGKHGGRVEDMIGESRVHKIVLARQEAMYEIRRRFPLYSLPRIGRLFGDRDHTTALHGIKTHARRNNLTMAGTP